MLVLLLLKHSSIERPVLLQFNLLHFQTGKMFRYFLLTLHRYALLREKEETPAYPVSVFYDNDDNIVVEILFLLHILAKKESPSTHCAVTVLIKLIRKLSCFGRLAHTQTRLTHTRNHMKAQTRLTWNLRILSQNNRFVVSIHQKTMIV